MDSWRSLDGKTINAPYYRESLDALREFPGNAKHLEAKKPYSRWYYGDHIVVSEIIKSHGDETIPHLTPNDRDRQAILRKFP